MAANKLVPVKMKKEHMALPEVQGFRCGSKSHETPLAEWIKKHSDEAIMRGNKVWLYRLESDEGALVGYGSLATGKIEITENNTKKLVKGYEIPMLALHEDFWGCPKGTKDDPEKKFSRQIVRHLQQEARAAQLRGQGQRERLLALYVHPDADKAQQLYCDCGFTFAPGRFLPDPDIPPPDRGLLGMDFVW